MKRRSRKKDESLTQTPEKHAALLRFNAYLVDLERFIVKGAVLLDRTLESRQADSADPMIDYELEAVIATIY